MICKYLVLLGGFMEKDKNYILWFSLGVSYYCFIEKIIFTMISKILLLPIADSNVSRLVFVRNISFILVISISIFLIKKFLEYDEEYYIQPMIFIFGIFMAYIFWNSYVFLNYRDFNFWEMLSTILPPALILVTERLLLVFVIWNGFSTGKQLIHFALAIGVQILIVIKGNYLNELLRRSVMNDRFPLDSDMVIWAVSFGFFVLFLPYIVFSKRFYETVDYPYE